MQTIQIEVQDSYANKVINILENLKGIFLEDILIKKRVDSVDNNMVSMINAQEEVMKKTWDNDEDEAWNEL